MEMLGMKANLPDVLAALLPGQIASYRRDAAEKTSRGGTIPRRFFRRPPPSRGNRRSLRQRRTSVPDRRASEVRNEAIGVLNARGIGCTVNYRAVPFTRYYRNKYRHSPNEYPVSHDWGTQTLTLPLYPSLTNEMQNRVIEVVTTDIYSLLN